MIAALVALYLLAGSGYALEEIRMQVDRGHKSMVFMWVCWLGWPLFAFLTVWAMLEYAIERVLQLGAER